MNDKNKLEKIIKSLYIDKKSEIKISAKLDKKILKDSLISFELSKKPKKSISQPNILQTILQSKIVKFAVIAVIVIAVLITVSHFGEAGVAWSKVAEKVSKIQSFFFQQKMTAGEVGKAEAIREMEHKIYFSSEYGYRAETKYNGDTRSTFITPPENMMLTVAWHEKKYMYVPWGDIRTKPIRDDPREFIKKFMTQDYTKLGRDVINGIEVEGIEVTSPLTIMAPLENEKSRLWVDVKTNLPVRVETESYHIDGFIQIIRDFHWKEKFDSSVFKKPDIPADFSLMIAEFKKLHDPEYGISIEGLSIDDACKKILTQFWNALINKDFLLVRHLFPAIDDWNDETIKKNFRFNIEEDITELLKIGKPLTIGTTRLGNAYEVPSIIKYKDGQIREFKMVIQFRQFDGKTSCVIYGTLGYPREID